MAITWGQDAFGVEGFGGVTNVAVEPSGVSASGVTGTAAPKSQNFIPVTGVVGTGQLGEELPLEGASWGLGGWGGPPGWSGITSAFVDVTGVLATSAVGTVAQRTTNYVTPQGVQATGQLGQAEIDATATVVISNGVSGAGSVGTVTTSAGAAAFVTGVVGSGSINGVGVSSKGSVTLSGVQAVGILGEEEISGASNVFPISVTGTGNIGTATISGTGSVVVSGVVGTTALGETDAQADTNAQPTGVSATGAVGSLTLAGDATVYLTGVSAQGLVSRPLVWGLIDTSQTPNWLPIAA